MKVHQQIECIKKILKNYSRNKKTPLNRNAAVLVILIEHKGHLSLLFTKRTRFLNNHSGEISFPGGSCEDDDETLRFTALRETWEEIGISDKNLEIIGKLDDEYSITNYKVTPYVAYSNLPFEKLDIKIDPKEVDLVFTANLLSLNNKINQWKERWVRDGYIREVYFFLADRYIIWGLTGRILKNFLTIIKPCLE